MKNLKIAFGAVLALSLMSLSLNAQTFSFTGTAGYARPQGDALVDQTTGKSLSSFRYRLFESDRKFSPYAGLGLGLAVFSTPDVTITDNITGSSTLVPGASAFSLGLAPELGLHISNFVISVAYIVPMKYTINSDTGDFNGTAGALNINLGFVYDFSL